jgi:hypothetical protein
MPQVPNLAAIPSTALTASENPAASTPTNRNVKPPNRNCKIGDAITANALQAVFRTTALIRLDESGDAVIPTGSYDCVRSRLKPSS